MLYFDIAGLEEHVNKRSKDFKPTLLKWQQIRKEVKENNIPFEDLGQHTQGIITIPEDEFMHFNSSDNERIIKAIHEQVKNSLISRIAFFQHNSFIGCLTEGNDCPLMWGHYADSHRGFCLEYDLSNNTFVLDNTKQGVKYFKNLYPVLYSQERYRANDFALWHLADIMGYTDNPLTDVLFWNKAFTHKSHKWEYEKEWRIIINPLVSEYGKLERYPLRLKPTAIYYGYRFEEQPEDYKTTLRQLAIKKGLKQYRMELKYDEKSYIITPELIF